MLEKCIKIHTHIQISGIDFMFTLNLCTIFHSLIFYFVHAFTLVPAQNSMKAPFIARRKIQSKIKNGEVNFEVTRYMDLN